jgi:hypothetical protein
MTFESYPASSGDHPSALWRDRCTNAWVGVLYEVSSVRASNWHFYDQGTIYINRYNNSDAFHRTKPMAQRQAERLRVRGAGWRITEWPCLVTSNTRGAVAAVQINTRKPFANWSLPYGQGSSLGAIARIWAKEAKVRGAKSESGVRYPAYTHVFLHTPNFECGCGKYQGTRFEMTICERCGVEVSRLPNDRKGYGVPVVERLTAPCRSWGSVPVGANYPLHWSVKGSRAIGLEPAFSHIGDLLTHLSR